MPPKTPVIDASAESVKRTLDTAQAVLDQTARQGDKSFTGSKEETEIKKKYTGGIITSKEAVNRAKSANETINNITPSKTGKEVENPLTEMYKRLSDLQGQLSKAQESEKAAKDKANGVDAGTALANTKSSNEVVTQGASDLNAAATALNGDGKTTDIVDPVVRALADKTIANVGIINNQMQTLGQYRQQFNEYTQQDIDSIARTAERSVQRQIEENKRTTDAMRFAGVIAGRAQFTPVVEQSIIKDVVQEGLDKIEVINEKKNTAIREARKAEADFNIDVFEKQANLAKEYNNEIESTISKMNAQVRQVEADERERTEFRQKQSDRDAFILAPELANATPEQIQAVAVANGIDIGLLAREVQTYKDEQAMQDLDIQSKQESILSSQANRRNDAIRLGLDQARFEREGKEASSEEEPLLTKDEIDKFTALYNIGEVSSDGKVTKTYIPSNWTRSDLNNFVSEYGNVPPKEIKNSITEYNDAMTLSDDELSAKYASKPVEETVAAVVNAMRDDSKTYSSTFNRELTKGERFFAGGEKKEFEAWVNRPVIQEKIKSLINSGMRSYEAVEEMKKLYGSTK